MSVCPLCNQLTNQVEVMCDHCQGSMADMGRVIDYFDDYSAYMEIDGMKLLDGYQADHKQQQCPHVFFCKNCGKDQVALIDEQSY